MEFFSMMNSPIIWFIYKIISLSNRTQFQKKLLIFSGLPNMGFLICGFSSVYTFFLLVELLKCIMPQWSLIGAPFRPHWNPNGPHWGLIGAAVGPQ